MKQELVLVQKKKLKPLPMFDLKFSDVLRSAEGKYTQCFGISRHLNSKGEFEYCAMGIVAHLMFGNNSGDVIHPFELQTPSFDQPCPTCTDDKKHLHVIAHLNDAHRWSFGQIANWLQYHGY